MKILEDDQLAMITTLVEKLSAKVGEHDPSITELRKLIAPSRLVDRLSDYGPGLSPLKVRQIALQPTLASAVLHLVRAVCCLLTTNEVVNLLEACGFSIKARDKYHSVEATLRRLSRVPRGGVEPLIFREGKKGAPRWIGRKPIRTPKRLEDSLHVSM
jgi:hypothetical protein